MESNYHQPIKKEILPRDASRKNKRIISGMKQTAKDPSQYLRRNTTSNYIQVNSLDDVIEVKPEKLNHLLSNDDMPCCICMEDNQTHYSACEKWDERTIEDIIEFTTGLKLHQAELKMICADCYIRMKVAYRFKIDCDKASELLTVIPLPATQPTKPSNLHSKPPPKKKRKCVTTTDKLEDVSDLFTFKNSSKNSSKLINESYMKFVREPKPSKAVVIPPVQVEKRLNHTCYMCKLEFSSTTLKTKHNEEVHKKDGYMICTYTLCNYTAPSWKEMCKHAFNHRPSTFMCDACGHKFKNPQALNAHMIIHIDDPEEKDKLKNYPCKLCSKKFSSSSRLSKHKRTHSKECFFKCGRCEKAYRTDITLKNHMMNVHGFEPKFICIACGSGFMQENGYRKHLDVCSK